MSFGDREDELWEAMKPSFKPRLVSDPNIKYAKHLVNRTGPFATRGALTSLGRTDVRATLARRQMTLERAEITKKAGNVGAASHDALEERDHPHTGRVGEELLDVEAVNDAVAAMARGIADVASPLHGSCG